MYIKSKCRPLVDSRTRTKVSRERMVWTNTKWRGFNILNVNAMLCNLCSHSMGVRKNGVRYRYLSDVNRGPRPHSSPPISVPACIRSDDGPLGRTKSKIDIHTSAAMTRDLLHWTARFLPRQRETGALFSPNLFLISSKLLVKCHFRVSS